jgi:periplasmic protein TonB
MKTCSRIFIIIFSFSVIASCTSSEMKKEIIPEKNVQHASEDQKSKSSFDDNFPGRSRSEKVAIPIQVIPDPGWPRDPREPVTFEPDPPDIVESGIVQPQVEDQILDYTEVMPEFPGGQVALNKYLANNIRYPEIAKEMGIEGTVYIGFVIETDGSVSNVVVKKSVHPSVDAEAKRVVMQMPKWSPGKQNGKPVRVRMVTPVKFRLQ